MTRVQSSTIPQPHLQPQDWLQSLLQTSPLRMGAPLTNAPAVRLIRLVEINEEGHRAYRQALANVYAALDPEQPVRLLYLLDGGPTGVALYLGVTADEGQADLHEGIKNLRGAMEGQLPGINFGEEVTEDARNDLLKRLRDATHQGVVLGAPTGQSENDTDDKDNFQGVDRLVRALQSGSRPDSQSDGRWQLVVVSQPLRQSEVRGLLDAAYALSSQLAGLVRTSVQASGNSSRQTGTSSGTSKTTGKNEGTSETLGKSESGTEGNTWGESSSRNSSSSQKAKNSGGSKSKTAGTTKSFTDSTGTSLSETKSENTSDSDTLGQTLGVTHEITDKRAQHLLDYIDKQLILRLQKGLSKGLFYSAVYITAENRSGYQRLKNTLRSILHSGEPTLSPIVIHDLPEGSKYSLLHMPAAVDLPPPSSLLFHSLHAGQRTLGSLLTADELAIVAGLPQHELQGIRRRKTVEFVVDLPEVPQDNALDLGNVIDRGRRYPNNLVRLDRADLNKHVFVTGVTGAGKTTTCLKLLIESGLPFLVIEPAKTEYRALAAFCGDGIDYYRPNGDPYQSLRINPFALVRKDQRIKSHAGFLKNVFAAVFPMEASMPMMVEAAILAAYEDRGWDIDENEFLAGGDPFDPSTLAWPTMSEMIHQLDRVIPTYCLGKEFEEKYRGSLVSRMRSLTDGTLGRVLDVPQSLDFEALLDRRAVIELEELQGGEEKALMMALLLGGINEAIRARHKRDSAFRQLTLIEEAHRLLGRPEAGNKTAAMAVEAFADMLAEVRKYGAGLIIADQIPAKLIPDVIKNTHTKIVHRLFAEDDRRTMGEAMMMDERQRNYLPNLGTGAAIVFCGGWHGPVHAAVREGRASTDGSADPRVDLESCGIRQIWRERHRYFPGFCQLAWSAGDDDDPARFASFVRETRQAQNQFLTLNRIRNLTGECGGSAIRAETAFDRLKTWHRRWHALAQKRQSAYTTFKQDVRQRSSDGMLLGATEPNSLLAAAWIALMLDSNPRPHAEEKNVPPLMPATQDEWQILASSCDALMHLLAISETSLELNSKSNDAVSLDVGARRDLRHHCIHLQRFKAI